MRFSLIPKEMKFFDMFDEATAMITRAGRKFEELVTQFDKLPERCGDLKQEERAVDEVIGQILKALDRSFITPFDREDIHTLATSLDDVMDNMEETSHRLQVFRIDRPPARAADMARIIRECCEHLEQAVALCRTMKQPAEIQMHLQEITRLENEADKIYRDSESALFAQPPDILMLIKLREIFGWLEETVDACKNTAQVISEIMVKGS